MRDSQLLKNIPVAALWLAVGLLFILIGLIELAVRYERVAVHSRQQKAMNADLVELSRMLNSELNAAVYFTLGLKAYIEGNDGHLKGREMELWLTDLHNRGKHIRNIGIAPDNRIRYIYPLVGNEGALGLHYPDLPAQWPGVLEVIRTKQAKLIGPFPLQQGGMGLVYREAVFLKNGQYWGIISTVINADSLFAALKQSADLMNMEIHLTDQDSGAVLIGAATEADVLRTELVVQLPGRHLLLTAYSPYAPISSWLMSLRMGGWLVSFIFVLILIRFAQSIKERSQALQALHDSQLRFSRAFSASPQGIALVDDKGNWIEVNASFCRMLGAATEYFQGKSIADIFVSTRQADVREKMQELINNYDSSVTHNWQCEAQLMTATGRAFMGLVSLSICFRNHQETHWIFQVIDISERMRLEQLKNDFVSTVSHELRTPLTSIMGGLKLLVGGQLGTFEPRVHKILTIATKNSERLMELINDILDMDKLIANKMEFNFQAQELVPIVQFSIDSNQAYAEQYSVNFAFNQPPEPVCVHVDSLRLQQVINNLLSNAAKFSPANSIVEINVELSADVVKILVKDKGDGISLEDQAKLFKKFSQVDSSSNRKKGGSGLGLAISKELIERMNGSIGVTSALGQGACFYIELPRVSCTVLAVS